MLRLREPFKIPLFLRKLNISIECVPLVALTCNSQHPCSYAIGSISDDTPHNQQWHHSHNDDKDHLDLPHINFYDEILSALFKKSTHEMDVV